VLVGGGLLLMAVGLIVLTTYGRLSDI